MLSGHVAAALARRLSRGERPGGGRVPHGRGPARGCADARPAHPGGAAARARPAPVRRAAPPSSQNFALLRVQDVCALLRCDLEASAVDVSADSSASVRHFRLIPSALWNEAQQAAFGH